MAKKTTQTTAAIDPVTARGLQGVHQAAIQAQCRMAQRDSGPWGAPMGSFEERQKDWAAIGKVNRRAGRGGDNFREEDMMGVPPRETPTKHR